VEKKSAPDANTTPGAHIAKPSGIAVNASVQLSPRTAPRGRGRANAPESLLFSRERPRGRRRGPLTANLLLKAHFIGHLDVSLDSSSRMLGQSAAVLLFKQHDHSALHPRPTHKRSII